MAMATKCSRWNRRRENLKSVPRLSEYKEGLLEGAQLLNDRRHPLSDGAKVWRAVSVGGSPSTPILLVIAGQNVSCSKADT